MSRAIQSVARSSGPTSQTVQDVLASTGKPLDEATLEFMEPRFAADFSHVPARSAVPSRELALGRPDDPMEHAADRTADLAMSTGRAVASGRTADFSHVRVHSGPRAAEAAEAVGARAFAVGHDIVFGAGEYQPHTTGGRRLLAHELAHVTQRTGTTIRRSSAPEEPRISYDVKIPEGISTRREMIRYAELKIFGRTTPLVWNPNTADADAWLNEPAKHVGKTLTFQVLRTEVAKYRVSASTEEKATSDRTYASLSADERTAVDAEIERRYRTSTGVELGPDRTKAGKAELWNAFRRQVLADRRKLAALPDAVKTVLGGPGNLTPAQYEVLSRLADKLSRLSAAELEDYRSKVTADTTDLNRLELSIDTYLAVKAQREKAQERRADIVQRLYGTQDLYTRYKHLGEAANMLELRANAMVVAGGGARANELRAQARQARQQELTDFTADLKTAGFTGVEDYARTLDAYENAFIEETVAIALDAIQKLEHQLWQAEQQYSNDAAVDALIAQARATFAPSLVARAQQKVEEAQRLSDRGRFQTVQGAADRGNRDSDAAGRKMNEAADLMRQASDEIKALPGQPLIGDRNFPRKELLTGNRASVKAAISGYLKDRRADVAKARTDLRDEPKIVYKLPQLIALSLSQQGIEAESVQRAVIGDRQAAYTADEMLFKIVLGVVGFALTLLSGGLGGVAAAAALTAAGVLSGYQALAEYKEYETRAGFAGVGLADEPSFTWVVVAVVGAGLDLGSAVAAIRAAKPLEGALRLFEKSHDLADLTPALEELPAQLRQSILHSAVAKIEADRALLRFGGKVTGSAYGGLGGLNAAPELAVYVHRVGRRGILAFDRFMQELKLRHLVDETKLGAEDLARLKTAFSEARAVVKDVQKAGKELGLTDEEIGGFIEQMAQHPTLTVDEVRAAMTDVAKLKPSAGAAKTARTAKPKIPLDVSERQSAAARLERIERELAETRASIEAENAAAVTAETELTAFSRLKPPQPPSLKGRLDRIGRLKTLEDKVEAVEALRRDAELTAEEKTFLDWQSHNLTLQQEAATARETSSALSARKLANLTTQRAAASAALRESSKDLVQVMRSYGPNYEAARRIAVDQVMPRATWDALAVKPPLATDHLVPLDQISKLPELDRLLALYQEASPALKESIKADLKALGDRPDNLVRMNAVANGSAMKSNKSWRDITYDQARRFGYTSANVDEMRKLEKASMDAILNRIEELTADYTAKVRP